MAPFDVTTLPLSPQNFWAIVAVLGFLMLTGLVYIVLSLIQTDRRGPIWENIGSGWLSVILPLGLVWLALFMLTLWAAVLGAIQMIHPAPSMGQSAASGSSGLGFGLGTLLIALLGAPFLIWNTVIKHKALGFQKEGHLTDRLSKAVEQLGVEKTVKLAGDETTQPNIAVRIGAILLLERIAQDSTNYDKGRDHVRVMEILCAYLRENAPDSGAKISLRERYETDTADGDGVQGLTDLEFADHHGITPTDLDEFIGIDRLKLWARSLAAPRADIALALQVIGRRNDAQRGVEARWGKDAAAEAIFVFDQPCPTLPDRVGINPSPLPVAELKAYKQKLEEWQTRIGGYGGYRLDLRATNLQGADLSDLNLAGARLDEARMEGANLSRAQMAGANLVQARMEGAGLGWAQMQGANLAGAWMQGANFQAQMQGANLALARMQGANFQAARMEGANLRYARMQGAYLQRAHLEGANLWGANMEGAGLSAAQMQGADLRNARMDADTQLRDAELRGAGLWNLDWSTVPISQGQIEAAFGDETVILPDGLTKPAHWPQGKLDGNDFTAEWRKWQSDLAAYTPPAP